MKKKENLNKISVLLFLILLIGLIPTFSHLFIRNLTSKFNDINIKSSDYWDLSAERILIDGDATGVGAHNWTWAVSQDWCTGLGTWASPYIIENVTINCNHMLYGMLIRDSNVPFRIQNCTIFNSGLNYGDSAILLDSVSNVTIYNNTIHSNNFGIYPFLSSNITITDNIIRNNSYGVYVSGSHDIYILGNYLEDSDITIYSDDNTIIGNTITCTYYGNGINSNSDYLNITGNTIFNCTKGINLESSEGNNVEGNHLYENNWGIFLSWVDNSNFTSNEIFDNKERGINFETVCKGNNFTNNMLTGSGVGVAFNTFDNMILYEPIDSSNTINSRPIYFYVNETGLAANMFTNAGQLLLINCNDSLISNANTSYCTYGTSLFYCNNITMTGCDMSNNNRAGLEIRYGSHNKLLNSTVNNNGLAIDGGGIGIDWSPYTYLYNNTVTNSFREGIQISQCNHSSIINNRVKNNGIHTGEGIEVSCWYCEVDGNIVNENDDTGILIYGSYNNITNNIAIGNYIGISVGEGYNIISGNTVNYNDNYGFSISEDYNKINWNTAMLNTVDGFYFYDSNFHTLTNNTAINNGWSGFHFEYCNNITLIENTLTNHADAGIDVENGYNFMIINNDLLNNGDGIWAKDCSDFLIYNNRMHDGGTGVYGWALNHSIITENNFYNNTGYSVCIVDSEDNLISDNKMNNGQLGLYMGNSINGLISDNEITMNLDRGLWIVECNDIELLNNNASYNQYGLWIKESTNLMVSGNTFNNNSYDGIVMWQAEDNEITSNTINGNELRGIWLYEGSTNNTITYNILIWNNQCIIEEDCYGNNILDNTCENRPQPPPTDGNGGRPPILGYDLFLLTIVSITLMIYLLKKHRSKIRYN
ncbi:MAG: NosD domain-containing protein [Promethearchaeota archaeon]